LFPRHVSQTASPSATQLQPLLLKGLSRNRRTLIRKCKCERVTVRKVLWGLD